MVDEDHPTGRAGSPDERHSRNGASNDDTREPGDTGPRTDTLPAEAVTEEDGSTRVSRRALLGSAAATVGAGLVPGSVTALEWCDADTSYDSDWHHHGEIITRCRYRLENSNNHVEARDGQGSTGYDTALAGWPPWTNPNLDSLHIHVHGHSTPAREGAGNATEQFDNIARMMGATGETDDDHWVFGFSWDSYLTRDGVDDGSWPRWKPSKSIARDNGVRLAAWINYFKENGGED